MRWVRLALAVAVVCIRPSMGDLLPQPCAGTAARGWSTGSQDLWAEPLSMSSQAQTLTEQTAAIQVDFSNPELSPSHWTLTFHPDGSGHFQSERGKMGAAELKTVEAPDVDRDIQLSAEFAERVFKTAQRHNFFRMECDSHMKVAFQGLKKLSYSGPDGAGECAFNYSRDKEIQALGDSLVAVAGTILEGARLELLLQHDRLGLDQEMDYLMEAAEDGRVQQIYAIRGILERLAEDETVLERVRKRARELLARAEG